MAGTYTYTFFAKDLMSSKFAQIAGFGRRMGNDVENANDRIRRSSRKAESAVSSLQKVARRWIGAFATFQTFKGIVNLGLDAETTRLKFETLLGSTEAATQMIANLNKFADKTPFDNGDLQRNAELLLNFGINGQKILPTLKMIGDVSGGNKEKLNSLTLAYAQVSSTGKLMGQDLLQMINAGFNPLQIISEKTGRSMASLKDAMSKGQIGAGLVEEAFRIATSEGGRFYGMMDKISTSGNGKISTFFGTLRTKVAVWSEKTLVPLIGRLAEFGTSVVNNFDRLKPAIDKFIAPFKPLFIELYKLISLMFGFTEASFTAESFVDGLSRAISFLSVGVEILAGGLTTIIRWLQPMAPVLKVLAIAYGVWTAAQWAINIAMYANPIGLIIAAIVALVGVIVYAYNKVGWFRGSIMAAWEAIKGFAQALKQVVIERIKEIVSGITGIGKTLMLFFKGEWKAAWEAGKKATQDLTGIGGNAQKNLISNLKKTGKQAGEAYNKGVAEAKANKEKGSLFNFSKPGGLGVKMENTSGGASGAASDLGSLTQGISDITGGGAKQTHITVNFGKLVENLTISTQNINQGVSQTEEDIKRMLLRVLNSVNQMQTSPV